NHPFGGLAHNPLPLRLVIRQFDPEGCTMSNNDPNQPGQPYNPDSSGQGSQQNPYGENPYGQNPYGQQPSAAGQNPYGQNPNPYGQPQAPGYDQYAAQGGYAAVQPPVERPRTLAIAFGLIML